ncbi:Cys-tRNA(Pro) deacylase [Rhodococcus sp. NPDC058521]|uniref:Cys-tRNA(Pro) deacylase n=1 Tax=Rhodococcus sp. NPDC058521 TaxID=3346536 RepID=UPI003660910B
MAGSATPATTALRKAGIEHCVHAYEHDPNADSYGTEAVDALGADLEITPMQVFKTLVVELDTGALAVAVLPVPRSLSLKSAASALGARKATMADPRRVERTTGYVLGGVSPLGQRKRLPTVLDESARALDRILCSAGRRGLEIEMSPTDLADLTAATIAPITSS